MKKAFLFFLIPLLVLACKKEEGQKEKAQSKISLSDTLIVNLKNKVTLLPEAREEVSDWLAYATATDAVQKLDGMTGREILAGSNSLVQIMETLRLTLPDTLRTPAIEARATVLLTKANVLNQKGKTENPNPERIFKLSKNLIVEFDNFQRQINEIYLKTPSDFEKQLDEAFEESLQQDSVSSDPNDPAAFDLQR